MKFSIMTALYSDGDKIACAWMQNHTGSLETAISRAKGVSMANSNSHIIIVEKVGGNPHLDDYTVRQEDVLYSTKDVMDLAKLTDFQH